ncbi:MAG: molybdopterin-dependent oxidoreductase [Anaerolineae bacterium]|nr:MAG: molybdopterin-dependent oxidoreductase [Anaerolineae bacterium]
MAINRRGFLKGSAGVAGGALAASFLLGELETLAPASSEAAALSEKWIPTTCWIGKQDCGLMARTVNGRVVSFEGHPDHPRNLGKLCPKGAGQITALYDPNRVKAPLIRTNEKGVPGTWRQVSWDEALELAAVKINEVRERDPRLLVWQKGRSKAKALYDKAFVKASGATKMGHGAYCSDAGYRALEYTIGQHGVLHPDFRHTRYLLSWGWNVTNAGGNKLCWLTWPQQLVQAKERGMKMVSIDPRLRSAAHFADEWLPIRPGTDLAMALGLCNLLIERGTVDRSYLRRFTNAPFLVQEDGRFLRAEPEGEDEQGKALVWDEALGRTVPYDTEAISPALEGTFTVRGVKVKPAFEVFKEHVAEYTPAFVSQVTGVPQQQVAQVARELGENAMIGSTMEIDGMQLPYRPVAIMAYHMAQQELGFQALRAMLMISMLLGAVGAVGGQRCDFTWKAHKNWAKLDEIKIKEPPYNLYLKDSKFYPINSALPGIAAKVMMTPEKYGVDYVPEVLILHHTNPLGSFPDREAFIQAYKRFKFVVAIDPWLSLTADLFADVVLPAATIEKYEGPLSATDQYVDATALRIPPMNPLFESKGDIDIYLDLCEKAGILYGEGGYLDHANKALKLEDPYALPLDRRPTVREIYERWAQASGIEDGVAFFEKSGVKVKGPVSARKYYGYATDPPFAGAYPHRLYGESLLGYQQQMQAMGVDKLYWQDYTPLPVWRPMTLERSPQEYDLYLMSHKLIEFKQSRTPLPLTVELAPRQFMEINPKTAKARRIDDGDEVWVESHNALSGDTRRVKVTASYRESIRPDTVSMPHHFGEYVKHPWIKGQGPSPNSLFFTGEGYVSNTADQTYLVKVQVTKA